MQKKENRKMNAIRKMKIFILIVLAAAVIVCQVNDSLVKETDSPGNETVTSDIVNEKEDTPSTDILFSVQLDEKWGYIDSTGKFVIRPQFDDAYNFSDNGLALVQMGDKWGYIDKTGSYVIESQFDRAAPFLENGLARVGNEDLE